MKTWQCTCGGGSCVSCLLRSTEKATAQGHIIRLDNWEELIKHIGLEWGAQEDVSFLVTRLFARWVAASGAAQHDYRHFCRVAAFQPTLHIQKFATCECVAALGNRVRVYNSLHCGNEPCVVLTLQATLGPATTMQVLLNEFFAAHAVEGSETDTCSICQGPLHIEHRSYPSAHRLPRTLLISVLRAVSDEQNLSSTLKSRKTYSSASMLTHCSL